MSLAWLSRATLIASALVVLGRLDVAAQSAAILQQARPTIPNVVGSSSQDATTILARTKLPVVARDTVVAGKPSGEVVAQRPAAGSLISKAKEITILVARSRRIPPSAIAIPVGALLPPTRFDPSVSHPPVPRDTVVPDLFGRSANAVAAALEANRLRLGTVTYDSSDRIGAGYAFEQTPTPGTRVRLGSTVSVVYSLGPHRSAITIVVPMLETKTVAEAIQILSLTRSGLRLGRLDTLYQQGGDGRIIHQEPHAGTRVHRGETVNATVALPPKLVAAPDVIGLLLTEARAKIESAGLDVGGVSVITRAGAKAGIDSQRPAAGTRVALHSLIDLVEGQPALAQVVVPNLSGKTEADARRLLALDSLSLGQVVRLDDDSTATIIAQQPAAGQTVDVRSPVDIRLGRGSTQRPDSVIPVPNVVNTSVAAAQEEVSKAGLSGIRVVGDATTGAIVIAQTPAAGTLVSPQSVITVRAETIITRLVPNLVDHTEDAASLIAKRDGFVVAVDSVFRRFTWYRTVVSQRPPAGAPAPADRRISVDLTIPVVPPIPLAITVGVLGVAGETVRRWRLRRFSIAVSTPPAELPHFASSGGEHVIRSTVEFLYEPGTQTWNVDAAGGTLIKTEKVRHG